MKRPGKVQASITCILPGLAWPGDNVGSSIADTHLEALATLFGRGTVKRSEPVPFLEWLGSAFGNGQALPWAMYRLAGEQQHLDVSKGENVLCADPVSLGFTRNALLLGSPGELKLNEDEAAELVTYLNEHFADIGQFSAAAPERWYLRTRAELGVHFHPIADVIGRPVAYFQPDGPNAPFWARTLNEIQVALYNHPINQLRLEQGKPTANGIWLWGGATGTVQTLRRPADTVISSDPLVLGVARASRANAVTEDAATPSHGRAGATWWHSGELATAAQEGSLVGWTAALLRLETDLLKPLMEAWKAGRIQALNLVAPCDKTLLEIRLDASSRWKFWRSALTHEQLVRCLQAPAASIPAQPDRPTPQ